MGSTIMDDVIQKFIDAVTTDCSINEVRLKLHKTNFVKYGNMKVNGFFQSYNGNAVLAVAMKKEESKWVKTLVHEYCHMQQWKENCPAWSNLKLSRQLNADDVMDCWLSGKRYTNATLDKAFDVVMKMELDCEKRVIETIKKYNLNIDVTEYIQRANAYVLFYKMVRKYKKWYVINKEPYNDESIWSKMPKTFNNIYDKPLCPTHENLLLKCFA
jgi:hypothetical protein